VVFLLLREDKYCCSKPDLILKASKSLSVFEIKKLNARGKISVALQPQRSFLGDLELAKIYSNLSTNSNGILSQFTCNSKFFLPRFFLFKSVFSFFFLFLSFSVLGL